MVIAIVFTVLVTICGVLLLVFLLMPSIMIKKSESHYSFDETIERLKAAVEERGWKVPCIHDFQETLAKNGLVVKRTIVIEVCKPPIVYRLLKGDKERYLSAIMPCRIAIYELNGHRVMISRMNGQSVGAYFTGAVRRCLKDAAKESEEIIWAAIGHQ